MKKTFQLLEREGIDYEFVDYKKSKPTEALLTEFLEHADLEELINKRGTTFRKLTDQEKAQLGDVSAAIPLLMENSSMIRRPIIRFPSGKLVVGLDEEEIVDKAKGLL